MEHIPSSETDSHLGGQEMAHLTQNPTLHSCVHETRHQSQLNAVSTFTPIYKIRLNSILPSTSGLPSDFSVEASWLKFCLLLSSPYAVDALWGFLCNDLLLLLLPIVQVCFHLILKRAHSVFFPRVRDRKEYKVGAEITLSESKSLCLHTPLWTVASCNDIR
jgi:hypothetical protein